MAEYQNALFNPKIKNDLLGGNALQIAPGQDVIALLAQQLRANGGDWNVGGIDRATEFAQQLAAGGVRSLDGVSLQTRAGAKGSPYLLSSGEGGDQYALTPDTPETYGLAFSDGTTFNGWGRVPKYGYGGLIPMGGWGAKPVINEGGDTAIPGAPEEAAGTPSYFMVGRSGAGKGQTDLMVRVGPDGKIAFEPEWGDAYGADRAAIASAAAVLSAGAMGLGGGGAAGAGGGAGGAGGGGLASSVGAGELTAGLAEYAASGLPASIMNPAIPGLSAAGAGAAVASPFSYAMPGQEAGFSFLNAGAPAAGDAGMAAAMDAAGSWTTPEALAAWGQSAGVGVPEMAASGAGLFGLSGDTLKSIGNFANLASPLISAGVDMYSANKAAGATNAATTQANDLLKYMYDTTRQDNMPGLQARNDALGKIQGLLSNPQSITGDPGYQFGLNQGTKAFENSAAARGMTYSGQQAKALTQFGQDYAGSKMDQSVNRLLQLANAGSGSAANIANAGSNYAGTAANNLTSQGTANALLAGANGNAVGNAINQLTAYGNSKKWWQG